jgi:hypothetical protein
MTVAQGAARAARSWRWPAACLLAAACVLIPSAARGDGGTLRYAKRGESMEVSIFTDSDTVYMGPVSFSIAFQPVNDDGRVPLPAYQISAHPVGKPEKTVKGPPSLAPALYKPFRTEPLELTEPGLWQFEVEANVGRRGDVPMEARFDLPVENGYAPRSSYAMWIGLPVVAVVIYVAHRRLTDRRRRQTRPTADAPPAG